MSKTYEATVDVFGDVLSVTWNGSVWISPCCGAQHSSRRDAMEVELRAYYRACGDDPDSHEIAEQIADHLNSIVRQMERGDETLHRVPRSAG